MICPKSHAPNIDAYDSLKTRPFIIRKKIILVYFVIDVILLNTFGIEILSREKKHVLLGFPSITTYVKKKKIEGGVRLFFVVSVPTWLI